MSSGTRHTHRLWTKLTIIYFTIQIIIRTYFLFERSTSFLHVLSTSFNGLLWDTGTWLILSLPFLLLATLTPLKLRLYLSNSKLKHLLTFVSSFVLGFIALSEILFWKEFHSRFNFIAVDYLIYTNEVLSTIKESFPMDLILGSLVFFALMVTWLSSFLTYSKLPPLTLKTRSLALIGVIFPALFLYVIGPRLETREENFHLNQIARNGIFEFARAFRANKITYRDFYLTLPSQDVKSILEQKQVFVNSPEITLSVKRPNIVLIVVESLGAKFIGPLSENKTTTPYLNSLAEKSLFFSNFYATGTRTVRGLEALTLSVPPTPGYAVVKRPDHQGLYSLGNTFTNNGYDPIFLYGGRGFFDNMNAFFSSNGFRVFDKTDFTEAETTFSNSWGVCDEDLFKKAKQKIGDLDQKKPFLMLLLTTSNHRPFTYPDGKIDIPSGEGRAGAVKYTDFAIGNFLEDVKSESWAKETIFVVVADHSTEGRGQFDLEMSDFHIPLWIYAPHLITPKVVSQFGSQIDLMPTLIHLLNLKDTSPFFGRSLLNENWTEDRAFVGNYQYVGYYKNKILTTLGPNRMVKNYSYDPATKIQRSIAESPYLDEAVSYYQMASEMLDQGQYKHPKNEQLVLKR